MYFCLRFNADHSRYSMGPGGCCIIFCCPCSEACGVHEAQEASSGIFEKVIADRTDTWQSPTSFVRTRAGALIEGRIPTPETFVKCCCC